MEPTAVPFTAIRAFTFVRTSVLEVELIPIKDKLALISYLPVTLTISVLPLTW